jgi:hypothetical protein
MIVSPFRKPTGNFCSRRTGLELAITEVCHPIRKPHQAGVHHPAALKTAEIPAIPSKIMHERELHHH